MFSRKFIKSKPFWRIPRRLRSSCGFTLVELIVIIVMVGILAAVVGMRSGWVTSGTNLRMAIDQVAGDLRFLAAPWPLWLTRRNVHEPGTFPNGANTYNLDGQVKSLPSGVTISSGLTVTFNSLGESVNVRHCYYAYFQTGP